MIECSGSDEYRELPVLRHVADIGHAPQFKGAFVAPPRIDALDWNPVTDNAFCQCCGDNVFMLKRFVGPLRNDAPEAVAFDGVTEVYMCA